MNSMEQKERHTAIAIMERKFKALEEAVADAYKVELDARLKGEERLKEVFAEMLDTETQFRKKAINELREEMRRMMALNVGILSSVLRAFVALPWWKRWLWTIFGVQALVWFPTPPITSVRHEMSDAQTAEPSENVSKKQAASVGVKP